MRGVDYRPADPRLLYLITQLVDVNASAEAGRLILNAEALPSDVRSQMEKLPQLEKENAQLRQALEEATEGLRVVQGA